MRYLYCDASWRDGMAGAAVVAPEAPWQRGASWRHRMNVRSRRVSSFSSRGRVFYAAFPSPNSKDAELRALGMACALASELLLETAGEDPEDPVEIVSDCLAALDEILWSEVCPQGSVAEDIQRFYRGKAILFSKVRAHRGHPGNELADTWARRARTREEKPATEREFPENPREESHPILMSERSKGDPITMKIPYNKSGAPLQKESPAHGSTGRGLFPGASPVDVLSMTEKALEGGDGGDFIAVITRDGHVVPRNRALQSGEKVFTELSKERVWGNGQGRGLYEEELARFTERILGDESEHPVVTADGKVLDRNGALERGERPAVELVKDRVWGGEDPMDHNEERMAEEIVAQSFDEIPELGDEALVPAPRMTVSYSSLALDRILAESLRDQESETGGALIGRMEKDDDGVVHVVVERATGPGTEGSRSRVHLRSDLEHYRRRVAYYRRTSGWTYVGEWHSHPGDLRTLSHTDRVTARELLRDEGWDCLVLPVVTRHRGVTHINTHVALKTADGGAEFLWMGEECAPQEETLGGLRRHEITLYLDARWLDSFREGDAETVEYAGLHHPEASFVFLPGPGEKNARLFMTKGESASFQDTGRAHVFGFITPTEARFFRMEEGEALSLPWRAVRPEEDVYVRNEGLLESLALRHRSVMLVGCGSLGSTMAVEFARAGIGRFVLWDPDRLEPHNIARHQGTLADLGRLKVHVVRDAIGGISPNAEVELYPWNIVQNEEIIAQAKAGAASCDLIVCTTDTDASRLFVNDISLELGIPSLQAGLHERAASGIVQVVGDHHAACFACHRGAVLREDGKRNAVAYSAAADPKDLVVQPGLSAQINLVAEVAVLRALEVLAGGEEGDDLTVVTMAPGVHEEPHEAISPWSGLQLRFFHFDLEKVPQCPVCGGTIAPEIPQDEDPWILGENFGEEPPSCDLREEDEKTSGPLPSSGAWKTL